MIFTICALTLSPSEKIAILLAILLLLFFPLYFHAFLLSQYELKLVASDNRNENHTTVVIHVKDVNDNPPMFDRPIYETQITEEDDRGLPKKILRVFTFSYISFSFFVSRFV